MLFCYRDWVKDLDLSDSDDGGGGNAPHVDNSIVDRTKAPTLIEP